MIDPSQLNNLDRALAKEAPEGSHRTKACFAEAYPVLVKHLERNISLKLILKGFNEAFELKVSLPRFRQLLRAERTLRSPLLDDTQSNTEKDDE